MKCIAQSTDNEAPMIVAHDRVLLSEGDPGRRLVIDETSAVVGRGAETRVSENAVVYELGGTVAVKLYPPGRDEEDRRAPLIGSFRGELLAGAPELEALVAEFEWFADAVGRPLDPGRVAEA